jgi:hypothetical protein
VPVGPGKLQQIFTKKFVDPSQEAIWGIYVYIKLYYMSKDYYNILGVKKDASKDE